MSKIQPWPVMGQAVASRAVNVLARYAAWRLTPCAPYHGLPLAGFLEEEAAALLVAVTDGVLSTACAGMHVPLCESRSDGLILSSTTIQHGLPEIALGLWRSGQVTWHWPLLAWLAVDATMWLVPARDDRSRDDPAFKLVARHLRADLVPWRTDRERSAGFARATEALADESADAAEDQG